jgi:hypothetical protein
METAKTQTPSVKPLTEAPRYTTFYRVMLILSTIGTSLSVLSLPVALLSIRDDFAVSVPFASLSIGTYLATVVSVAALIFLWQKRNPLGIYLKIGTYAVLFIVSVGQLFFLEPVIADAVQQIMKEDTGQSEEAVRAASSLGIYTAYALTFVSTIVMSTLWWFAYKGQRAADKEV